MSNDFWRFEISKHNFLLCSVFMFMKMILFFYYALGLDSCVVIGESHFDLNVVYNFKVFLCYVLCVI
jgi:hypothetical protein